MQPCSQINIMDEILYGREENSNLDSLTETSQLLYLFPEPKLKKMPKEARTSAAGTKRKVTHYLTPGTRNKLDDFRQQLLLLFPAIKKNTFSRSNIVDKTLELFIGRFHQERDQDELLKILLGREKT